MLLSLLIYAKLEAVVYAYVSVNGVIASTCIRIDYAECMQINYELTLSLTPEDDSNMGI